jgi:hypothetical protein
VPEFQVDESIISSRSVLLSPMSSFLPSTIEQFELVQFLHSCVPLAVPTNCAGLVDSNVNSFGGITSRAIGKIVDFC